MGKRVLVQKKGRGTITWRSLRHLKLGNVTQPPVDPKNPDRVQTAKIVDLIHEPGRGAPLAELLLDSGKKHLWLPPEGVFVGDTLEFGPQTELKIGNTMEVRNIPEGAYVYNIEKQPRDGGKYCRTSGGFAILVSRTEKEVTIRLPSGKIVAVHPKARATIGVVAGSGRPQKPFVRAGSKYHYMQKKTTLWPVVGACKKNAVCHPFGGGRKKGPGRPSTTSRNAPPGRKIGLIAARRTGRKKK